MKEATDLVKLPLRGGTCYGVILRTVVEMITLECSLPGRQSR